MLKFHPYQQHLIERMRALRRRWLAFHSRAGNAQRPPRTTPSER